MSLNNFIGKKFLTQTIIHESIFYKLCFNTKIQILMIIEIM
jgi:hypothetical protein